MNFFEWANFHRIGILVCGAVLGCFGIVMVIVSPSRDTFLTALFWWALAAASIWLSEVHLLFRQSTNQADGEASETAGSKKSTSKTRKADTQLKDVYKAGFIEDLRFWLGTLLHYALIVIFIGLMGAIVVSRWVWIPFLSPITQMSYFSILHWLPIVIPFSILLWLIERTGSRF